MVGPPSSWSRDLEDAVASTPLRLVRTSNSCSPRRRGSDSFSAHVGADFPFSYVGGFSGEAGIVLLKALLGVVGVYDVGSLVHVSLLVGLMLLLLVMLKARDAAASDRTDSGAGQKRCSSSQAP
jgi:hypothetical protein